MELNITRLHDRSDLMSDFSSSVSELGEDAGNTTWRNAMRYVGRHPLMTVEQLPFFRDYAREFGAWEDDEIDGWSNDECNALCLQMIAGDIRERQLAIDDGRLEAYEENQGGRISVSESGQAFYYIGI